MDIVVWILNIGTESVQILPHIGLLCNRKVMRSYSKWTLQEMNKVSLLLDIYL